MKGLELAEGFYREYGKPMLEKDFGEVLPYLAVAFTGSGSEHYGFDDGISTDHDFEPGFCIFLPEESVVDRRTEFLLERAYAKLPKEYAGVRRQPLSPVGGNRHGVIRLASYFQSAVGDPEGMLTADAWLHIPDYALAEAVNGTVFHDGYGALTAIRNRLETMPQDILLKRLAGNLLLMAQAGQYNFTRCLRHCEPEAAQLACTEFVNASMKSFFLLKGKYMPYYKWSFRALRNLAPESVLPELLSEILFLDHRDPDNAEKKADFIESVATLMIDELQERNLTKAICGDLEKHAYSVNDMIADSNLRNMHILAGI